MITGSLRAVAFVVLFAATSVFQAKAWADPAPAPSPAPGAQDGSCSDAQKSVVSTQHQSTVAGRTVSYTATVGFEQITVGAAKACVFFTAYQVKQPEGSPSRPVTFAFNGGPGAASLWLHLGALGPKRVNLGNEGLTAPVPFQLVNNDDSPLDLTDIVMVDPVATGFSHVEPGSSNTAFFGAKNDSISVATFIRDFLDRFNLRSSPLYVMGESYGGVRGSLVTQRLQSDFSIPVKGLILVSPFLSTTALNFGEDDNDVPYVTFLPNYAASARYHQKAAAQYLALDVASTYQSARAFANGRYRQALDQGNDLDPVEFHAVAKQLSDFTGIAQDRVEASNLRITDSQFFALLLDKERQEIGRFDSRFVQPRLTNQNPRDATDPSDVGLAFPFVGAINSYLRNDLGFSSATPYVDSANVGSWPFESDGSEFSVTRNLSQALADNAQLRVFVASGYYDLACPMGTVEFERERLDPAINPNRMMLHHYEAGHMVYINPTALHQFKADLSAFYLGLGI